ncbi:MAG: lytic transglycosylase domain-containing protein [Desulfobacterales bacterium]|jgi:soluble lytic murein transglycosylase-like protein
MTYNTLSSISEQPNRRIFEIVNGYRNSTTTRQSASGQASFKNLLSAALARFTSRKYKIRGLTIADYRAHPVLSKSRFKAPPPPTINEKKYSALNRIPARSLSAATDKNSRPQLETRTQKIAPANKAAPAIQKPRSFLTERDKIEESIQKAAAKYNLPPGLIRAVIQAESNFQVDAVSRAGARGLMQLMPATARELGVTDSFDIDQNIDGGAKYLRSMLDRFGGNVRKALAAYNAGPGTVIKYNGQVPYTETRQYVKRVLRLTKQSV